MAKNKAKNKNNRTVCSVEQAINDANWDKYSPWSALVDKCKAPVWKEQELAGEKQPIINS